MMSGFVFVSPWATFIEPGATSDSPVKRFAVLCMRRFRYLLSTVSQVSVCVWKEREGEEREKEEEKKKKKQKRMKLKSS